MVVTNEVELPEFEEVTYPEVNVSTATLIAAAPYLGQLCEDINNEFMLCRQEYKDARACVELGKKVSNCAMLVFRNIKLKCLEEFNQHANCIDHSSGDYSYRNCRKTQAVFDTCMYEKMCVKRPEFGYFTRGRVHQTKTPYPPPPPCPREPKPEDAPEYLPDCRPRPEPRLGSRLFWVLE